ncbi:MAG: dynamin family protein, partial [Ruegeria sp.]
MNFLLRQQALPTQVTATQLPPVWFSHGDRPAYVKGHDGSVREIELDQLDQLGVNDAQFVRIYLEADILEAVDLIDTPGISDPKISTDVWRRAVGQANGVIWCTHSTQAWRETERATWVSLPERLQNNSLLLVTRADALDLKDRQKVLRRVNREAGHLFNRSILFSARDAIVARDKSGDAELWSRSGGGKMVDSFLEITESIMDARAQQLGRYQVNNSQSGGATVRPVRPSRDRQDAIGNLDQPSTDTTPLKLVNPVMSENADAVPVVQEDAVVTNFPVRPARVERRSDESGRARIAAEAAERMRAEVVTDAPAAEELDTDDMNEDELRSFFKESSSDPLEMSDGDSFFDQSDLGDEDNLDEDEDENILGASYDEADISDADDDEPDASALMASVSGKLANTDDAPVVAPEPAASTIDVSDSSIAAFMAEEENQGCGENGQDADSEASAGADVLSMSAQSPNEDDPLAEDDSNELSPSLESLVDVPAGTPLSAAALWNKIAETEDLPDDANGLHSAFQTFLEE